MIPVLTVNKLDYAVPLCNALVKDGLTVIEITLLTQPALAAVERLAKVLSKICIGIRTGSEAITGYRHGLRSLKNFPAKTAGGFYRLQQLAPLFPNLKFCPTGGIGFMEAPT
jgi:2-dehydro-3-deoxyphosphogluconate aldolase/(4S)-4-hydroxy-2-oxoglutarate aldolase